MNPADNAIATQIIQPLLLKTGSPHQGVGPHQPVLRREDIMGKFILRLEHLEPRFIVGSDKQFPHIGRVADPRVGGKALHLHSVVQLAVHHLQDGTWNGQRLGIFFPPAPPLPVSGPVRPPLAALLKPGHGLSTPL